MKLTQAQKELLLELRECHANENQIECFPRERQTVEALVRKGLLEIIYELEKYYYVMLTELGKMCEWPNEIVEDEYDSGYD